MARAKQILTDHADGHHQLAQLLIEREVITSEDVERILGARPWKSRGDELLEANRNEEANAQNAKTKRKRAPRKPKTDENSQTEQ
jgi:cell division protease FtsH